MARILIGVAIAFWPPLLAFGQEQTYLAQTPAPPANVSVSASAARSPSDPSDGSGDNLVLKDGQAIVLRSTRRLSSETAKVGDIVQFEVIRPVTVGDLVVIPEGAVASGRIVTAQKKKRRLRSGKLAVAIEHIAIVTGQYAPLRSAEVRGVESRDYSQPSGSGDPLAAGAIFAAPVFWLAAHGRKVDIPLAARVTAYLDGDFVLDREAVQKAQATLPNPRTDVGTVYVYRNTVYVDRDRSLRPDRDYPNNFTSTTCGEALLGRFHPGQYIRLQLPPGQYWLRASAPVRIDRTVDKKILEGKRKQFFPLNVEEGHSYYLRIATRRINWEKSETYLEQVDQTTGADAVFAAQSWADMASEDITPEMLSHLQAQPKAESDKSDWRWYGDEREL